MQAALEAQMLRRREGLRDLPGNRAARCRTRAGQVCAS